MTYQIKDLWQGDHFRYGGKEWAMLDQETGGGRAITKDVVAMSPFDEGESKNWTEASLKALMNETILKTLTDAGASADAFTDQEVDLKAVDGAETYGKDTCKLAPLTDTQYDLYRTVIPAATENWWLVTPYSHNEPYIGGTYTQLVRFIHPDGSKDGIVADGGLYGARPAAVFEGDTTVEIISSEIDDDIYKIYTYEGAVVPTDQGNILAAGLKTMIGKTAAKLAHIPAVTEGKAAAATPYENMDDVATYQAIRSIAGNGNTDGRTIRTLTAVLGDKI